MSTRKGPAESATLYKEGTKKKGLDGSMWQIVRNKNGVPRWQRVAPKAGKRLTTLKEKARTAEKLTSSSTSNHRVLFCEPSTANLGKVTGKYGRVGFAGGLILKVNDTLYRKLEKDPKPFLEKKEARNAYIFGPKFALSSYKFLGEHGNDVAQTGFVDLDILDKQPIDRDEFFKETSKLYIDGRHVHSWSDPKILQQVREKYPAILFLGDTRGGDVGAALFGHFSSTGELDSLIIDVWYFFEKDSSGKMIPRSL